jgi:hypothetical protein
MKANAPERLYLSETIYSTYLYQVPDPDDESAVEYTRTDAFIKKAKKWFKNQPETYDANGIRCYGTEDFEDFRKYMEE